jgi:L,D-transpeptidase ErfK/SrfK
MRMYPEDIEALFPLVPVGTKVRIVNEPVKVAFVNGELLLEVHPPVDKEGQTIEPDLELFSKLLDQALGPTIAAVHWDLAREVMRSANGLPTVVGIQADVDTPETQTAGTTEPAPGTPPDVTAPATAPIDASTTPTPPSATSPAQPVPPVASAPTAATSVLVPRTLEAAPAPSPAVAPGQALAPADRRAEALPATPPQVLPPPNAAPLPLPSLPPEDNSRAPSASGTRTFPAGDPDASTAQPVAPTGDASPPPEQQPGTAVASAPDNPQR